MAVTQSKKNQVEGPIMQAKEWTRAFGRYNPVEHAVTKQQSKNECSGRKSEPGGAWRPPGRPASPYLEPLVLSFGR
jgi:hypothetical protein